MVYLRDAADFAAMNQAYASFFPHDPPTRTTIVVPPADPKVLVEVSAVALVPGAERRVVLPAGWKPSPNPYSYGILSGDTLFLSGSSRATRRTTASRAATSRPRPAPCSRAPVRS